MTSTAFPYAPRTCAVLLVSFAVLAGLFTDISAGRNFAWWGFAAGAVAGLLVCALIGRVARWREGRR